MNFYVQFILILLASLQLAIGAKKENSKNYKTMNYDSFMANHSDIKRRLLMWKYFQIAEKESLSIIKNNSKWKSLKRVIIGKKGPMWYSNGKIELKKNSSVGSMFHEVFHNAYNGSNLKIGKDNKWSEAFCDAFRYMLEKKYFKKESKWYRKVKRYSKQTYKQVMKKSGDKKFDRKYCYPASLIIRKSGRNLEGFRNLWFKLIDLKKQNNKVILDEFFKYEI